MRRRSCGEQQEDVSLERLILAAARMHGTRWTGTDEGARDVTVSGSLTKTRDGEL